jgi:hypothetical protein
MCDYGQIFLSKIVIVYILIYQTSPYKLKACQSFLQKCKIIIFTRREKNSCLIFQHFKKCYDHVIVSRPVVQFTLQLLMPNCLVISIILVSYLCNVHIKYIKYICVLYFL